MKLSGVINLYKNIFTIKNGIDSFDFQYTGTHKKNMDTLCALWLEMAGRVFSVDFFLYHVTFWNNL